MYRIGRSFALVSFVVFAACSGRGGGGVARERTRAGGVNTDSADVTGMADMPGMAGESKAAQPKAGDDGAGVETAASGTVTFSAAQVRHGGVRWSSAGVGQASDIVLLPGQIVPNEDRTARLGAPVRGRVLAVAVMPGERVAKGQLLVTLQSPDAGAAQSDVSKASAELVSREAQATYTRAARDRAERLLALKAMPRQDYERAIADDELAQAALSQARAELTRARSSATQLGANASPSGVISIRAPLAGAVLARTASAGAVVDAGAALVIVTDPSSLWLTVAAPEQLAGVFRVSAPMRFTVPAYPADTFVARTQSVGAGLDADTRTLPVRAVIDDPQQRLKPEMLASVVTRGISRRAVMVPDSAVQLIAGKPTVFVAVPNAAGGVRLTAREVDVGERVDGQVPILRGLAVGELVVVAGAYSVQAELAKSTAPKMEM